MNNPFTLSLALSFHLKHSFHLSVYLSAVIRGDPRQTVSRERERKRRRNFATLIEVTVQIHAAYRGKSSCPQLHLVFWSYRSIFLSRSLSLSHSLVHVDVSERALYSRLRYCHDSGEGDEDKRKNEREAHQHFVTQRNKRSGCFESTEHAHSEKHTRSSCTARDRIGSLGHSVDAGSTFVDFAILLPQKYTRYII